MDKKLIFTCLITGIITTVVSGLLFLSGVFLFSLLGTFFIPGLLFGLVVSTYFNDGESTHRFIFTIICSIIYLFSAFITFYLNAATNYIVLAFYSTLTLPLITLLFDSLIKKLENKKKSLTIALIGGFFSGIIIYALLHFIRLSNIINFQGENGAFAETITQLLIFPFWQTFFAFTIKLKNKG
ncbi:MAG TPA: hypothetical protein PKZ75_04615 [Bacteroidia bacterium]|nr:hypothetical protein [Bacteroidia bacterium]